MSNKCTLTDDELIEACNDWVSKLAKSGRRDWSLQVPVNFNKDPDMLFCELADRFKKLKNITPMKRLTRSDAAQLRIGNYLNWHDKDTHSILQIDAYDAFFIADRVEYSDIFSFIELTPEILEKTGFEKCGELKSFWVLNIVNIDLLGNTFLKMGVNNIILHSKIKHLHQLQNLFFALTGEELKIDL